MQSTLREHGSVLYVLLELGMPTDGHCKVDEFIMSTRRKSGQQTEKSVLNIWKVNLDIYHFWWLQSDVPAN